MGGDGSIHGSAFNPLDKWGDKSTWQKVASLSGLPVGSAVGSPKWIKQHPKEAMLAAATAATVFSGGAAAGLWGGAAGAAGAGTAAAGEGAAGAGLLGSAAASAPAVGMGMGGGTAALFGPTAASEAALSMSAPLAMDTGLSIGAAAPSLDMAAVSAPGANAGLFAKGQGLLSNINLKSGMKGLNMARNAGLFNQPQQAPVSAPRAYGGPPPQNTQLYQPSTKLSADQMKNLTPEQLKALLALLQQQQT